MSYELKDFRTDVLEACMQQPVLVDFWAPWCGPCKTLGPILEKLAAATKGAWRLVKINVDNHQAIAGQFGVQSIPAVFLIYQGGIVAHFSGAQTEAFISQWLSENLPEGTEPEEGDETQENATDMESLEQKLVEEPDNHAAKLSLATALVFQDTARANQLLQEIPEGEKEADQAKQLHYLTSALLTSPADLPDHDKIKPHFEAGLRALASQDFVAAIEAFLDVLYRDKNYAEDGARLAILGIFAFLGRHHEIPTKYFRRFEMALF